MTITLLVMLPSFVTVFYNSTNSTYENSNNCDSSYPDFSIRPPPPNLNCDDIQGNDFRALSPDPHGLDRNGDGIGCESEVQP
jgi:hypothetical protein